MYLQCSLLHIPELVEPSTDNATEENPLQLVAFFNLQFKYYTCSSLWKLLT